MRGEEMEGIYQWIKSLVIYLILMSMVLNMLPDKKYEKYMRLFTGVVFLLLAFGPFADLTGLEERMAGAFERITFQNDARLLQKEIEDADGRRLSGLMESYKKAVETDLKVMAEGLSVECRSVVAEIETDMESGRFGCVVSVDMRLGLSERPEAVGTSEAGAEDMAAAVDGTGLSPGETRERRLYVNREIGNLKKRIGEYYGVEEGKITIFLEN